MAREFRCTRSIVIDAPPEAILAEIADLKRHIAWSPFSKPDPKTRDAYAGAPGAGQSRAFEGGQFGAGAVMIESVTADRVVMRLDMRKPMKVTNQITYVLEREGQGTRVSWTLAGPETIMFKVMSLFMDCDKMCGRLIEEGLSNLKAHTEPAQVAS